VAVAEQGVTREQVDAKDRVLIVTLEIELRAEQLLDRLPPALVLVRVRVRFRVRVRVRVRVRGRGRGRGRG